MKASTYRRARIAVLLLATVVFANILVAETREKLKDQYHLYDGISYPQGTYSRDCSNIVWQGMFQIVDGGLRYIHEGALDTTGHMLSLSNGMSAKRPLAYEQVVMQMRARSDRKPIFFMFLCRIAGVETNITIMKLIREFNDQKLTIGCNSTQFWFGSVSEKNRATAPIPKSDRHKGDTLVCLAIEGSMKSTRYGISLNPPLDTNPSEASMNWSSAIAGNDLCIREIQLSAPTGTCIAIDEIRFGPHVSEAGFKCPEYDKNKHYQAGRIEYEAPVINDHNAWVNRNSSRYSAQSFKQNRGLPPALATELLNDIEWLESRINTIFSEEPPRWHLPQFAQQWEKAEAYEKIIKNVINQIKGSCK